MALDLGGAYGLQSFEDLLQRRMAAKLAAQKTAEETRRFNVQSGEVERAHNLTRDWHQLQREQNAQNQANLQQGRQFEQANKIAEEAVPGDVLDQGGVAAMHAANLGGRILSTPQDPYEGVDVTQMGGPGVTQRPSKPTDTTGVLRAGSKWQTGEATRANQLKMEQEKTTAATATQTAAEEGRNERAQQHEENLRALKSMGGAAQDTARLDKSYTQTTRRVDTLAKPVIERQGRLQRLEDTLSQNSPQADALVAPELLTAMAGGQGSGLRMNEAEIARIVGGRTNWETLKAAANKWSLNPETAVSITSSQRQQIRSLLKATKQRNDDAISKIQKAGDDLSGAESVGEHRRIHDTLQRDLTTMAPASGGGETAAAPGRTRYDMKGNIIK